MLAVNTKKTDKAELLKPLTKYVQKEFSSEAANEHSGPLNRVHGLREEIRLSFGNEKTEAARTKLLECARPLSPACAAAADACASPQVLCPRLLRRASLSHPREGSAWPQPSPRPHPAPLLTCVDQDQLLLVRQRHQQALL